MSMGTAGVVLDAVSRAREMHRKTVGAAMSRIYARIAARQEYEHRKRVLGEDFEFENLTLEEFECFHVCDGCGYLGDGKDNCPSCGSDIWIDVRN